MLVVSGAVCSGERGERPDPGQHGGELVLPGPAGGHPEGPLAAAAGQAGGDLEQLAAAGASGLDGRRRAGRSG